MSRRLRTLLRSKASGALRSNLLEFTRLISWAEEYSKCLSLARLSEERTAHLNAHDSVAVLCSACDPRQRAKSMANSHSISAGWVTSAANWRLAAIFCAGFSVFVASCEQKCAIFTGRGCKKYSARGLRERDVDGQIAAAAHCAGRDSWHFSSGLKRRRWLSRPSGVIGQLGLYFVRTYSCTVLFPMLIAIPHGRRARGPLPKPIIRNALHIHGGHLLLCPEAAPSQCARPSATIERFTSTAHARAQMNGNRRG